MADKDRRGIEKLRFRFDVFKVIGDSEAVDPFDAFASLWPRKGIAAPHYPPYAKA